MRQEISQLFMPAPLLHAVEDVNQVAPGNCLLKLNVLPSLNQHHDLTAVDPALP
jgi:hypothetical protein